MVDGEVVEDPEDDVESGNNSCCGCFNSTVPDTEAYEMVDIVPEEKFNLFNVEGGEVTEGPCDDLETISQSEDEAETILRDLIDTVINDIIMLNLEKGEDTEAPADDLETIRQSENEAETIVRDLIDTVITDIIM